MDSAEAAQAETEIKPKSSADWVELLVQQMAGAKDLNDARSRATQMLQAFEQAVLQQASQVGILQSCRPPGNLCAIVPDVSICTGSVPSPWRLEPQRIGIARLDSEPEEDK